MKGTKGKLNKTRLTKKAGSVKLSKDVPFKFSRGTTHIFKIKGPELGDIRSIQISVMNQLHNGCHSLMCIEGFEMGCKAILHAIYM